MSNSYFYIKYSIFAVPAAPWEKKCGLKTPFYSNLIYGPSGSLVLHNFRKLIFFINFSSSSTFAFFLEVLCYSSYFAEALVINRGGHKPL